MKKLICLTSALLVLSLGVTGCGSRVTEPEPTTVITGATLDEAMELNDVMLLSSAKAVAQFQGVKREHYENGGYYYLDITEDKSVRCVSSCYANSIKEDESEEDYAKRRAVGVSMSLTPGNPTELSVAKNQQLTDALGAPVYLVSYVTGSQEAPVRWTVYLTRNDHYAYQYAFCTTADADEKLDDKIMSYFYTLKLEQMEH